VSLNSDYLFINETSLAIRVEFSFKLVGVEEILLTLFYPGLGFRHETSDMNSWVWVCLFSYHVKSIQKV
jgi:hypothetical protein